MSSPETPDADADKAGGPVTPRDVERYICDVDDLLLDIPWRRRRELIASLREHLQENAEQIRTEPPQQYAAELRDAFPVAPGGRLSGLRSMSWPTPPQWWESVIRGWALLLIPWVVYDFLAPTSQAIFGDPSAGPKSWSTMLDSALQNSYPTPTLGGSHRGGLLVFTVLAVLIGQLTTGAVLTRAPHLRCKLRILTYLAVFVIIGLFGYGAVR